MTVAHRVSTSIIDYRLSITPIQNRVRNIRHTSRSRLRVEGYHRDYNHPAFRHSPMYMWVSGWSDCKLDPFGTTLRLPSNARTL